LSESIKIIAYGLLSLTANSGREALHNHKAIYKHFNPSYKNKVLNALIWDSRNPFYYFFLLIRAKTVPTIKAPKCPCQIIDVGKIAENA
mgnify:CR=1